MSQNLLKSTSVVSSMTLISRLLGFFRDMLAAQIFGADATVDAFMIAFKLPNFMRSLFAEGAFSQAFVPILADYRLHKTQEEARLFMSHIAGCLSFILFVITLLGMIFMPWLVKLIAPGFEFYRLHLATIFCRITFPYLLLISLAAFIGATLNSYGKFTVTALTPALLNICLIIGALYGTHFFALPIESQVWGIVIAGILQIMVQLPLLKRLGFLTWPRINWQDEGVKRVLKLMVPTLFGASIVQIGVLINTVFASYLKVGSVTWLYYSERLAYFPQGVIGVALTTVILPHLSRQFAKKSETGFNHTLNWGLRCNLLVGIPAALTMAILAGPLVTTLFHYGHFNVMDVLMTRQSVIAYAVGLPAFMLVKLLASSFYARRNVHTPVRVGIAAVTINIVFNCLLIKHFAHAGLALATSLSSWFYAITLLFLLLKRRIYYFARDWRLFMTRLLIANGFTAAWLWWQQQSLKHWLMASTWQRVDQLSFIMLTAIIIYFSSLLVLGMRWSDFKVNEIPDKPLANK